MKQLRFICLLLALAMMGCNKDDDDAIEITAYNIAAQWRITATDRGMGWTSCDTEDYDASSWLILSYDGSCFFFLKECVISGNYSFNDNTAILSDMDGVVKGNCVFTEVREHTAMATVTTIDNVKVNIRMVRDNRESLMYRDPVTFLNGQWKLIKSKLFDDSDYKTDNDGSVVFDGNHAIFKIKGNKYSTTFYRYSFYGVVAVYGNEGFFIRSVKYSDDIEVYSQKEMKNMIFRRQMNNSFFAFSNLTV